MDFFSPLRYPGGKGKVSNYFKELFVTNGLCDGTYVEPYAGGASVALSLLFSEYASRIVINDKDRSIYAFWHSVLYNTEQLSRLINDCKINFRNWETQRSIQKKKSDFDLVTLGFSTFFLNRVNRSGIIMAGIIGGKEQNGKWKMDARFNKKDLISRIQRIASYSDRIDLHNKDAALLINKVEPNLPHRSFLYLDPPYYNKGSVLYMNHYQNDDHARISESMSAPKHRKWVVSYDDVEPIRKLYTNFRQVHYSISYSASQKTNKGDEIMIYSDGLLIPPTTIRKSKSM